MSPSKSNRGARIGWVACLAATGLVLAIPGVAPAVDQEVGAGKPFATIGAAIAASTAGVDRVVVFDGTYNEQAVAVVPTIVTEVPADRFLAHLVHNPKAATELYKQLAQKLTAAREDAAGLVFDDCHSRLVKALVGLLTAMTALGAPLGIWLTAKATAAETAQQRQGKAAQDATTTASSAKAESSTVSKEIDELRQRERARRAYDREVFRRMGVIIPKVEGDPDPPQLDVEVPLRNPGTVTPGPVLVVKTPPP